MPQFLQVRSNDAPLLTKSASSAGMHATMTGTERGSGVSLMPPPLSLESVPLLDRPHDGVEAPDEVIRVDPSIRYLAHIEVEVAA